MKKLLNILAVSLFMIGMIACDKIEEPYFRPNNEDSEHLPLSDDDISNWENKKVVLLEDYTGVRCVNCPAAAEIVAIAGSNTREKASIRPIVSRPRPIIALTSVMASAVIAAAPATCVTRDPCF